MDTSNTTNSGSYRFAHKNVVASGLVALFVLSIGIYVNHSGSFTGKNTTNTALVATNTDNLTTDDISMRDSDNDGLPDWEERLSGSDPFVADTDGDGTPDGQEVAEGRDPTKAGPNDFLPSQLSSFATSSSDLEGLKKDFFKKYLTEASRDIRETTFRSLINNGFDKKNYTPTNELLDLTVSSDSSIAGLRAYGNAFGVIINKYTEHPLRKEEDIFADGMKTKNDASLADLQLLVIAYRNFSADLKALPVPLPLAKYHLKIVNGYDGMARGLLGMSHLYSDPINGAAGYEAYTKNRLDMIDGYAGVVSYLRNQHVTFTSDEPGYPFYSSGTNSAQ